MAVGTALLLGACAGGDDEGGSTAVASAGQPAPVEGFGQAAVRVERADEVVGGGCALVADDAEARAQGLMGRRELGGHVGMVFVFEEPVTGRFWMRNTPLPLSIAFFDDEGRFVSSTAMAPCDDRADCPRYAAGGPYRYALEVPQGDLEDLGVGPGAVLHLGGPCR